MTRDPGDDQLERLFAELRQADADAAPAFSTVWRAAAERATRRPRAPAALRIAAAVLLPLAVGVGAAVLLHRAPPRAVATTALTTWRSPTAFLLRGPGDGMLQTVPAVSASVVRLELLRFESTNQ